MSVFQNAFDQSQSQNILQLNDSLTSSIAPIKRKNSSPLASSVAPDDDLAELPKSSPLPPQPLRKSVSVDSFAPYNREYWPNRRQSVPKPEVFRSPAAQSTTHAGRLPVCRVRGESLGTVPCGLRRDLDGDRYDPLSAAATERYRRGLLKTHEATKPSIRGGDLPLPSRTVSNSISTIASTSSTLPSYAKKSSRQGSDRPGSSGSRSRSDSIGYDPRKIMINTKVSVGHLFLSFGLSIHGFLARQRHRSFGSGNTWLWQEHPHSKGSFRSQLG